MPSTCAKSARPTPPAGSPPPNSCGTKSTGSNQQRRTVKVFGQAFFKRLAVSKDSVFGRLPRVGHNLHLNRADPPLHYGQPSSASVCPPFPTRSYDLVGTPEIPFFRRALPAIAVPTCVLGRRKSVKGNHQGSLSRLIGADFAHRAKSAAAGHSPAAFYKERVRPYLLSCPDYPFAEQTKIFLYPPSFRKMHLSPSKGRGLPQCRHKLRQRGVLGVPPPRRYHFLLLALSGQRDKN